ncbi:MAG: hypothetical protein QM496_18195 [Verrucomicrobiota bacterium]
MFRITFLCPHACFLAAVLIGAPFWLTPAFAQSNKSTAKKDRVYANASMVDLGAKGAYIKTSEGLKLVPWADLSKFQVGTIRNSFQDALYNIRLKAYWVQGEVFQAGKDGVVVNTGLVKDEKEDAKKEAPDHKRGAEIASGLVLIKDLAGALEEGDPVSTYAYDLGGTFKYDIGFGKKDLKILSIAKPTWAQPSEWSDTKGRKMLAELVEVAHGKCRFLRNNKEFLFPLDQLNATDQKRAVKQQAFMRVIPLPEG